MTNAVNLSALGSNGGTSIATWTTGTRPTSPLTGQIGFNATLGSLEIYNGTSWATAGGLNTQSVQTTGFTAVAGNIYPCNTTSAAFTVTLPSSPVAGNQIQIIDYAGTFGTNAVTLGRNGLNITGQASNYLLNTNREAVILTYIDATQGWVVSSAAYTTSPIAPPIYTASYLIVSGGAGGGVDAYSAARGAGGGGAGGYLAGSLSLNIGTNYSVTVGAGGAGGSGSSYPGIIGTNGSVSTFNSLSPVGGGGGGGHSTGSQYPGVAGGSGGGGSNDAVGGAGTAGQGNNGGAGVSGVANFGGGGGGGGGAVGGNGSGSNGGAGGIGTTSSITGSSVYYCGGGGGGGRGVTGGAGGNGGGGTGNTSAGTANTGGGGGGSGSPAYAGGSGVVILSVPTANYTGITTGSPTITTSGSNTIIKFTSSGSYTA